MCVPFEIVTDSHSQNFGALHNLKALVVVNCDGVFYTWSFGKLIWSALHLDVFGWNLFTSDQSATCDMES